MFMKDVVSSNIDACAHELHLAAIKPEREGERERENRVKLKVKRIKLQ